jgi:hypothetical protein
MIVLAACGDDGAAPGDGSVNDTGAVDAPFTGDPLLGIGRLTGQP